MSVRCGRLNVATKSASQNIFQGYIWKERGIGALPVSVAGLRLRPAVMVQVERSDFVARDVPAKQ